MRRNGAPETLKEIISHAVETAHLENHGCVARTAKQLGISKTTVYRWLGIIHEEKRRPKVDPNQMNLPGIA